MRRRSTADRIGRLVREPWRLPASLVFHAGRRLYPRYRRPMVVLFRYTRALGDNLMLTTVAREVRKRNPGALIHVVTGLPELFARNPDVDLVSADPERPTPLLGRYLISYEDRFPWGRHLLHYCAECVDIRDGIDLRTYIYPSDEDREHAAALLERIGEAPVLINRVAGPRTDKKNWPTEYWKVVVERLASHSPVVDVGSASTPALERSPDGYHDLLGRTTIHQLAALMQQSRLIVAPVSGPLHLAAACGLQALSIVGGTEPAIATQYPGCRALVDRPPCRDCYESGPCRHSLSCLLSISPDQVTEAALSMLRAEGSQLQRQCA